MSKIGLMNCCPSEGRVSQLCACLAQQAHGYHMSAAEVLDLQPASCPDKRLRNLLYDGSLSATRLLCSCICIAGPDQP